jgi:hypothetical protein
MRVTIYSPPPPITIGEGEDAFTLQLCRITGSDRGAVIDACALGSIEAITRSVDRLVDKWTGIIDENGAPVPLEGRDGATGKDIRLFQRVVGAMPLGPATHRQQQVGRGNRPDSCQRRSFQCVADG